MKLLKTFLFHPNQEFYVRELTRLLDEQINGIRRELAVLKKIGLIRQRTHQRKKHFMANTSCIIFEELRSIFTKILFEKKDIATNLDEYTNNGIEFLLLAGKYAKPENDAPVDMLIITDVEKDSIVSFFDTLSEQGEEIRYALMTPSTFLYRLQYNDAFILSLIKNKQNKFAINRLKKFVKNP